MNAGTLPTALDALVGLAHLLAQEAEPEAAVESLALVLHHPAARQIDRDRTQGLLAELESGMAPDEFAAAVARGEARQLEEVAAEILRRYTDAAGGDRD